MMEWRTIKESPKDDEIVLAYFDSGGLTGCAIAYYDTGEWFEVLGDNVKRADYDPTHWMPLPEAPKC